MYLAGVKGTERETPANRCGDATETPEGCFLTGRCSASPMKRSRPSPARSGGRTPRLPARGAPGRYPRETYTRHFRPDGDRDPGTACMAASSFGGKRRNARARTAPAPLEPAEEAGETRDNSGVKDSCRPLLSQV